MSDTPSQQTDRLELLGLDQDILTDADLAEVVEQRGVLQLAQIVPIEAKLGEAPVRGSIDDLGERDRQGRDPLAVPGGGRVALLDRLDAGAHEALEQRLEVDGERTLLWVLRTDLGVTGPKYGCGIGECGACTVHVDGQPMRACVVPASTAEGKAVTTIEGVSGDGNHPVQVAWRQLNVAQCGYCQSGQIMSAIALLNRIPKPTDDEIDAAMSGNICRCGTYTRIREAIHRAAEEQS